MAKVRKKRDFTGLTEVGSPDYWAELNQVYGPRGAKKHVDYSEPLSSNPEIRSMQMASWSEAERHAANQQIEAKNQALARKRKAHRQTLRARDAKIHRAEAKRAAVRPAPVEPEPVEDDGPEL